MKKRTIIIIVSIVAALLLIGILLWQLIPRLALSALIKTTLPEFESAQMFDSYDITDDSLVEISTDGYTIDIPSGLIEKDMGELAAKYYHNADHTTSVCLVTDAEPLEMNLLDPEKYKDIEGMPSYVAVDNMEKAFESLGNGVIPDNTYNTLKSAALLDSSDYNFWSIENTVGYIVMGSVKLALAYMGDTQYIYERDDARAIVYVKNPIEDMNYYTVTAELYSTDDLNTAHFLIINAPTLNEAYAVLNSVKFD